MRVLSAVSGPGSVAGLPGAPAPARAPGPRWFERQSFVLLLVFLLVALRRPDVLFRPQFEAEDGSIFFGQNANFGWHAIFIPHGGYLHVIPRLLALLAGCLPIGSQPAAYAVLGLGVLLAVVARLLRSTVPLPHKPWLALAIVLGVRGTGELLANLVALQWFLSLVPLMMLLEGERPRPRWEEALELTSLALIGLSTPIVALCVPLFALRCAGERSRWSVLCLGIALATGLVQADGFHRQPVDPSVLPTAAQWATFLGSKCAGVLLFGSRWAGEVVSPWIALGLLAGIVALLVGLHRRQPARRGVVVVLAGFGSLVLLAGALRFVKTIDVCLPILHEDRYLYLPRLMLVWCLLLSVDPARGWQRGLTVGALALAAWSAIVDFRCPAPPDFHWAQQTAGVRPGQWNWLHCQPSWNIYLDGPTLAADGPAQGPVPDPARWKPVLATAPVLMKPAAGGDAVSIDGRSFLQLPAPGLLIFDIPVQTRMVGGRCALPPGLPADAGATEFRLVLLSDYLPPRLLWSRRLDPAVPGDRLPVRFQGVLPFNDTGQLMLSVRSVVPGNRAVACWADLVFH